jgi:hypothetical protein
VVRGGSPKFETGLRHFISSDGIDHHMHARIMQQLAHDPAGTAYFFANLYRWYGGM